MALAERDRRALMIFGAVVVVALAAYFLLLKKDDGTAQVAAPSPTSSVPVTTGSTPPTTAPSTSAPATPRKKPPPSELPLGGKDPFSPLVNPSGGGGGPSTTGPSDGGGNPTPTGTGVGTGTPTGSPTSSESPNPTVSPPSSPSNAPGGGTSTHIGGHTVTLLDIFERDGVDKAQVQVDSTVHTVEEGDTFSDGFELVSISGTCATFTRSGQQFVLCENPQK